ncbi:MAG TPA: DUF2786 domain-containing protein [Phycisphaerales bacterium]|nr:DUF2786 domain-containing protein [Phycisphaerales bacterium]
MPTILHSSRHEIRNPVFIDYDALAKLDAMMREAADSFAAILNQRRDEAIKKYIEERTSAKRTGACKEDELRWQTNAESHHPPIIVSTELELKLKSGQNLKGTTLIEAFNEPGLQNDRCIEFTYKAEADGGSYRVGRFSITVDWDGNDLFDKLTVRANPDHNVEVGQRAYSIAEWLKTLEPGAVCRIWHQYRWVIFILLTTPTISVWVQLHTGSTSRISPEYLSRVRKLLSDKIDTTNEHEALELCLQYISGQATELVRWNIPAALDWLLYALIAVGIIAGIACPQTELAIGRGKQRIKYWRTWIEFALKKLPWVIFAAIVGRLIVTGFGI